MARPLPVCDFIRLLLHSTGITNRWELIASFSDSQNQEDMFHQWHLTFGKMQMFESSDQKPNAWIGHCQTCSLVCDCRRACRISGITRWEVAFPDWENREFQILMSLNHIKSLLYISPSRTFVKQSECFLNVDIWALGPVLAAETARNGAFRCLRDASALARSLCRARVAQNMKSVTRKVSNLVEDLPWYIPFTLHPFSGCHSKRRSIAFSSKGPYWQLQLGLSSSFHR